MDRKIKAKWHGFPYFDTSLRKWLVTFELDVKPDFFDKTRDKLLALVVKVWREKRSSSANSYFHVLVDAMAEALGVGHFEIHNQMIALYGYVDESIPGGTWLRDDIPWESIDSVHLRPTTEFEVIGGEVMRRYDIMRGSHTYDTKEMTHLIEGVIYEAKSLGLETATPDELERMRQQWNL